MSPGGKRGSRALGHQRQRVGWNVAVHERPGADDRDTADVNTSEDFDARPDRGPVLDRHGLDDHPRSSALARPTMACSVVHTRPCGPMPTFRPIVTLPCSANDENEESRSLRRASSCPGGRRKGPRDSISQRLRGSSIPRSGRSGCGHDRRPSSEVCTREGRPRRGWVEGNVRTSGHAGPEHGPRSRCDANRGAVAAAFAGG